MRKPTLIFGVTLCASLVANAVLVRRAAKLRSEIEWERVEAQREGEAQAEADYAAGRPCLYVVGDFGGAPPDKASRRLVKFGCMTSEYRSTFAQAYNTRMDQRLSTASTQPSPQ